MEWPLAFYLCVVFFAVQLWVYGCFGCFYEEESALLELKSSINHPNSTSLPSWRVGADCCTWEGVTCSSTVGRVIALDLSSTREEYLDKEDWSMNEWYLNASLLLPFEELQSVDLRDNFLTGFMDEEALNKWSRLSKLEELDLSDNHLNETILPFLGALKSLKQLKVRGNNFIGPLPNKALNKWSRLSKLEELDLSYNIHLNEAILPFLGALKSLKQLKVRGNNFIGPLPIKAIETLTSLRTIDFSFNIFNDSQSIQGFCKLKDLQRLDLSNNYFKGPIPLCLGNLTSLQLLNLSKNGFSGILLTSTTGNDESQGPLPIKGKLTGMQHFHNGGTSERQKELKKWSWTSKLQEVRSSVLVPVHTTGRTGKNPSRESKCCCGALSIGSSTGSFYR